tara:strand:+ start:3240 stop:4181 length:942 start_codon:yes stop_codon:yes gene_type:complete
MITIITTTINDPTTATKKFAKLAQDNNWTFVIVGDTKTPHNSYNDLSKQYDRVKYLSPEDQDKLYPDISNIIGWKTIQRRNIGFLYAYNELQSEIIATVDDDNIPYDDWGQNILVNKNITVDVYENRVNEYFDPFSVTNQKHLWHRGYPVEHITTKNDIDHVGVESINVKIQADFWNGDPDIDSICRLTSKPLVKFNNFDPFTTYQPAPFNSQNTFLSRDVFPLYSVWPNVGRMDDIWASYYVRKFFNKNIIYCPPSVYQERNPQDLVTNLENECIGYRYTKQFIDNMYNIQHDFIPEKTRQFIHLYSNAFKK